MKIVAVIISRDLDRGLWIGEVVFSNGQRLEGDFNGAFTTDIPQAKVLDKVRHAMHKDGNNYAIGRKYDALDIIAWMPDVWRLHSRMTTSEALAIAQRSAVEEYMNKVKLARRMQEAEAPRGWRYAETGPEDHFEPC